jgi:imidazolonepropionase-like amidohydrolase
LQNPLSETDLSREEDAMKILCRRGLPLSAAAALLLFLSVSRALAQTAPVAGLHQNTPRVYALTNARLVTAPGKVVEGGTLVVRDGRIEAAGRGITAPPDAVVRDLGGRTVYPGFIDLFSSYGISGTLPAPAQAPGGPRNWNPAVHPEQRAAELFRPDEKAAEPLRRNGFTTVLTFPQDGFFRGSGALVLLSTVPAGKAVLAGDPALAMSFTRGSANPGRGVEAYPASLMGGIALVRQTLLDALWYGRAHQAYGRSPAGQDAPETDLALEALEPCAAGRKTVILATSSELDLLRAAKLAREFSLRLWAVGSGTEYRRIEAVKAAGLRLILPLNFPDPPDVSTPARELEVSLRDLKYWDIAPENPGRLDAAGVELALTASGLEKPEDFLARLRTAVKRGLPADRALAALTTAPASWLGKENLLGSLEPGRLASFIVTDGDLFEEKTRIIETWVAGERYEIKPEPLAAVIGKWEIALKTGEREQAGTLKVSGDPAHLTAELELAGRKVKASSAALDKRMFLLSFPGDSLGFPGLARLSGMVEESGVSGGGVWGEGTRLAWQARLVEPGTAAQDTTKPAAVEMAAIPVVYPDGAYGRSAPPPQPEKLLVRNATLWTCGPAGKLEGADLLVEKGRIVAVGRGLAAPAGAQVIDAAGRHVTPGMIDAHSHVAITWGVNEATHAVTPEVRISDVLDSDDIDLYRQLAGGVTAALTIHGSANPIGGLASLIKFRWGALPDELLFEGQKPVIKFALGENVKQSYLPEGSSDRYPKTRMGVEQIFLDAFQAARDYRRRWEIYEAGRKKNPDLVPPRRDLRQEALLDVLDGKTQVHCHSYRQDEILAMLRVAERCGFRIGVFIHVLEGYKVADAIKKHGAMPTTFSDWWAYKFEVYDAIPYNGALMNEQGLTVSFNSDDAELARRLNLEAAKAVKYGGVPPEEALKFVTLNPARQLGVSGRLGSLEPGKDADFVIWSGSPLSVYSRCEQTWVDGRKYFDRDEDRLAVLRADRERAALVQKVLRQKGGDARASK